MPLCYSEIAMQKKSIFKKCYAHHLGGCNHKSQEHFISKSLLKIIGVFEVKGFPWSTPDTATRASSKSLTASVLCDHHNSLLSDFDSETARLMSHLKLLDSKTTPQELLSTPNEFIVDGIKLEKWLLKSLCGIMSSGNFMIESRSFGKVQPSQYLVNLLFSSEPWKPGIGLYLEYSEHKRVNAMRGVGYDPVLAKSRSHSNIVGIDMHLWGFPFRGLFATYEDGVALPNYRPNKMRISNGDVVRDVVFAWPSTSVTSEGPVLTRDGTLHISNS
ncbi:MAG: hypothetical protein DU480_05630 [Nitrosomonas sp.]